MNTGLGSVVPSGSLFLCLLLCLPAVALEDICDDGIDNDGDTLVDCEDPNCVGKPCEDGDPCTEGDTCNQAGRCAFGVLYCDGVDCFCPAGADCLLDTNRCKERVCDDEVDNDWDGGTDCWDVDCLNQPCDDGDPCNTMDRCTGTGSGCSGQGYLCNETNCPCGLGQRCIPNGRRCAEDNCVDGQDNDFDGKTDCADPDCDSRPCDDRVDCTVDDACISLFCRGTPVDARCTDTVACTRDVCNLGSGCTHVPEHQLCSDGFFCNGSEICDADLGCRAGSARCQDPGAECDEDADICREIDCADGIDNEGDHKEDCEDPDCEGRSCADPEGCIAVLCDGGECSARMPDDALCDDQDPCTEEWCDGSTGECERRCIAQDAEDALKALEAKADAAEGKLDALGAAVGGLEAKADAGEGKLDTLGAAVGSLEAKADRADLQRATLEGKSDSLEAKADLLEGKADALEVKMDEMQALLEDLARALLWEQLLIDKDCVPTLWLPTAQGGRLEEVRDHVARRIGAAAAAGDPRPNLAVAQARLVEADAAYGEGRYQDSCRRLSDALRALTTP